jgi:hypothetical protein
MILEAVKFSMKGPADLALDEEPLSSDLESNVVGGANELPSPYFIRVLRPFPKVSSS